MSASPKAKPSLLGSYPRAFVESKINYNMWKPDFPDWYYYNTMPTNSNAQLPHTPYPPPQAYMQTYSYIHPMQHPLPHHAPHENVLSRAPIQSPALAQIQAQAQKHAWLAYQAQQLKHHNFSYWYGLNQQLAGRAHHQNDALKQQPTITMMERPTRSSGSQPYSHDTRLPGCGPDHSFYSQMSSGGSLNRIDSISSFKNQYGLHVRNSQHDMHTYQRIAERRLKSPANDTEPNQEPEQQQAEELLNDQPMAELKPQASKLIQPTKLASKVSVQSRGNSLFKKLGLVKQRKNKSIDLSKSDSKNTQECTATSSQKPRKKPNLFKRIFGGKHYPSTVRGSALIKKDQHEAIEFETMRAKH
ncbi:uncharacterized protein LOC6576561 [Drosophila mojavensis]|uniref:Uncharacterized protein n=1 Tax=Drosophila mojavensis TaxID=7230 RepID=B4KF92_DROMO|nr:uncharacterized protein LOC6576561 [Drosophila mojavensis]EDW11992.2 uncharacterized protein Dmoj_GI12112 [Drosophila mojavensis]